MSESTECNLCEATIENGIHPFNCNCVCHHKCNDGCMM